MKLRNFLLSFLYLNRLWYEIYFMMFPNELFPYILPVHHSTILNLLWDHIWSCSTVVACKVFPEFWKERDNSGWICTNSLDLIFLVVNRNQWSTAVFDSFLSVLHMKWKFLEFLTYTDRPVVLFLGVFKYVDSCTESIF